MVSLQDFTVFLWKLVGGGLIALAVLLFVKFYLQRSGRGEKQHLQVRDGLNGSGLDRSDTPDGFIYGLKHGKKVYQTYQNEGHIAVFGGSGQGKTSALLIPSLRVWQGASFCIDISGDICKNVPCDKKIILAPDDPENSCTFNPLEAIDAEPDKDIKRILMEQLVNDMLPISPKDSGTQQYFIKKARVLFLAGLMTFYDYGCDFCEICHEIFFRSVADLYAVVEISGNPIAICYIQTIKGENEKNIAGAKSTLDDAIRIFADNKNMSQVLRRQDAKQAFRLSDLENSHIFLVVPDSKQEYYGIFQHLVIGQVLGYISKRSYDREKDKRILLALDEFASLKHLELLGPMRKFRKNGANICLLTQSLADIDLVYSIDERKVILDNARYIVVLSAQDVDTRRYFSDLVGKQETQRKSTTSGDHGGSSTTSYQEEYAIHPNKWRDLGDKLIVIHGGGYIMLKKNYYFKKRRGKNEY